jgi:hypothetical protein
MATSAGDRGDERSIGIAPVRRRALFPVHGDYSSETKPFYLTSEFLVYALFMIGLGIAAATDATIDSRFFWIWGTVATVAYMLSRGVAKSGSRSRAYDPREDIDLGRD